jgi:hypothetical protein
MQAGLPSHSRPDLPSLNGRSEHTFPQTFAHGLPTPQAERPAPPLGNWQAQGPADQISLLHAQVNFLQRTLGEEVQNHNQTRAKLQYYCDSALAWERHYCYGQAQVRDLNAVIFNLQQKVRELEPRLSGRRMAEPMVRASTSNDSEERTQPDIKQPGRRMMEPTAKEQDVSTGNNRKEGAQPVCI